MTTLAPAAAIMTAISRPMPPPAPVTTPTLPSSIGSGMALSVFREDAIRPAEACKPGGGVCKRQQPLEAVPAAPHVPEQDRPGPLLPPGRTTDAAIIEAYRL